ncbi:MAG: hypothetical protein COA44_14930 [Arcobacter sp.]|nr:MAG: hypothetical protein COA44_14930 [Arcobacter sp.]
MRKILLLISLSLMLFSETEFSEPIPSMMEPRKIVFTISSENKKEINHVLSTANNVLKFYGPEKVNMTIVAYSGGIEGVLKKNSKIAERVRSLMMYEVVFIACDNTMSTRDIEHSELIEGTQIVTAGIVEVIERVQDGWIYIKL